MGRTAPAGASTPADLRRRATSSAKGKPRTSWTGSVATSCMGSRSTRPAGGTLFRDYAESWRAAQVHRASTAAQAETYLRLHAYPTLGRRPLGAIRRSEVQAWVKSLSIKLAPRLS